MVSDTQVVFRRIDHSQAVADAVQKRLDKLERYCDEIQSLRVTLESPHNHHHKGKVFHVGVEAIIPNHDILVNHDQHDNHSHEDIFTWLFVMPSMRWSDRLKVFMKNVAIKIDQHPNLQIPCKFPKSLKYPV